MSNTNIVFAPIPSRPRFIDLFGQTFSNLTVLGYAGEDRSGKQVRDLWWCQCKCGSITKPRADHLRSGNTTNCGCVRRAKVGAVRETHGHCKNHSHSAEYGIWCAMIQRCHANDNAAYRHYGGRGITVCPRWRESFAAFLADMGPRPGKGWAIERADNNSGYQPDNCRWATHREQMQNTRRNHFITFQGTTLCVTEWARRIGIPAPTLFNRLHDSKWSVEKALTTPLKRR